MTRIILDMFFRGRWDLFAHFWVNMTLIVFVYLFVGVWAWVVPMFFIFKEIVEWRVRKYFAWGDVEYNLYGLVAAILYLWLLQHAG